MDPVAALCNKLYLPWQVADEVASKWDHAEADDHFPLGEHMFLFAVKAALIALMGDKFQDDKEALAFKHSYDVVWAMLYSYGVV